MVAAGSNSLRLRTPRLPSRAALMMARTERLRAMAPALQFAAKGLQASARLVK